MQQPLEGDHAVGVVVPIGRIEIGDQADALTRGDRFPAWQKDPLGETLRAIEGIPGDKVFVDGYADFQRDMVYGEKPDFGTAMGSLNRLADQLRKLST